MVLVAIVCMVMKTEMNDDDNNFYPIERKCVAISSRLSPFIESKSNFAEKFISRHFKKLSIEFSR